MKHAKFISIILCLFVLLCTVGCAGSKDTTISQPPAVKDDLTIYDSVLQLYRDAITNNYYINEDVPPETLPSELLIAAGYIDNFKTAYAFYDIDKNGTNELFIGAGENDIYTIYDVYTYNDNSTKRLFSEYSFGYRLNLNVYNDGFFELIGSNSAFESYVEYCRLDAEKGDVRVINTLSEVYDVENEGMPTFLNNGRKITQEEYNSIIEQNTLSGTVSFDWQPLNP